MKKVFINPYYSVSIESDKFGIYFYRINNEEKGYGMGLYDTFTELKKELKTSFTLDNQSISNLKKELTK